MNNIKSFTKKYLNKINEFDFSSLTDEELKDKTPYFKKKIEEGLTLDDILPEAFAVVREASVRTLSMRPYDVQLLGGIALHKGSIAELKTGEGKSLAAVAPAYLNALTSKCVHIVTVNDYLASRDAAELAPLYNFLGLTVSAITHETSQAERKELYKSDVLYITNSELGFDYLKDYNTEVVYIERMPNISSSKIKETFNL